ncbi:MAG: prenyltransferase/squalene oxidase repeat-containing protein [Gemmatimonadota bacterium]|nr:prenyltransferase/squalene oxidase repeat-containing protein [Gemmatimonadota bacterium]
MNRAVEQLLDIRSEDGGFGPYPGSDSRTEASAVAALALLRAGGPDAAERAAAAIGWLEARQLASGAWPLGPGQDTPHWSTSLAVLALAYAETGDPAALAVGARWLLEEEGRGQPWWVSVLYRLFPERRNVALDANLIGWPWASGTFSWVEPTSYALLALKRVPAADADRAAARISEAEGLLADRACVGGGWNYGNRTVLGEDLWPYPDTTAAALFALADRADLPEVAAALDVLPEMALETGSILALGMAALALAMHGRDANALRERLDEALAAWESGEIRALAWAALGLADTPNPLEIPVG